VPCELAHQRVSTRLYPNEVVIVSDDGVVARHVRCNQRGQVVYDWQHYISLVQRKPGALRNGAPFAEMPEALQRLRQGLLKQVGGDKIMAQVLNCVSVHGLDTVLVACDLVLETGMISLPHVMNVLARLESASKPVDAASPIMLKVPPLANTSRYDGLRQERQASHA
jgi:hypothetical protein